jgi:hypothetical protein
MSNIARPNQEKFKSTDSHVDLADSHVDLADSLAKLPHIGLYKTQPLSENAAATKDSGGIKSPNNESTSVDPTVQIETEQRYLESHKQSAELTARYNDPRSQREAVKQTLDQVALEYGIEPNKPPAEIHGKTYSDVRTALTRSVDSTIDTLFTDDRGGTLTVDKRKIVKDQTHKFLEHLDQAIKDGQVPADISATDVYRLVESNVLALRLQETAALETALGDHGIRHLVDHNINVCESLCDQLAAQGVKITALDRLVLHQAMIDHDLGYAMDSIRDPINRDGIRGQDAGHNVLAAQYVRQWAAEADSPLSAVFDDKARQLIHQAILYHDKGVTGQPEIVLSVDPNVHKSVTLTSIVQIADNTAAFSQKLAGVLYEVPETLKYMRLLKTAHEINDPGLASQLRDRLVEHIGDMEGLSPIDRKSLQLSVKMLPAEGYKFSVGRICGNEAEYSAALQPNGSVKVDISVQESNIHQQMVSLFDVQQLQQLNKFVSDLTGKKVDLANQPDIDSIDTPVISIKLRKGREKDSELRDKFELKVIEIITDPELGSFSRNDHILAQKHLPIDKLVNQFNKKLINDAALRSSVGLQYKGDFAQTASISEILQRLQESSQTIKNERQELLKDYLASNGQ